MYNWREFFQTYRTIEIRNDEDLLYQVGTTVGGEPISHEQFSCMVEEITKRLNLTPDDRLLDFCCGNGVITYELSRLVHSVVGIDGAEAYIKNAIDKKSANNICYMVSDALDFDYIVHNTEDAKYSKVLFYGSLAYFDKSSFEKILQFFFEYSTVNSTILIGSILNRSKKFTYFNTFRRRFQYVFFYLILRKDHGLGRWWTRRELTRISEKHGFNISFFNQSLGLHTAHYRFDIVLNKKIAN